MRQLVHRVHLRRGRLPRLRSGERLLLPAESSLASSAFAATVTFTAHAATAATLSAGPSSATKSKAAAEATAAAKAAGSVASGKGLLRALDRLRACRVLRA